ncbi:MAG: four helix bundle protein [Candidatus Paceibacterota bacterium]|jgi:esterase/lipase
MSLYSSLSVYKASYDLLIQLFVSIKNFEREYKFTVGENIKKEGMEMVKNIYRANSSLVKKQLIQSARENIEMIRLNLRILQDLKQINLKKFVFLNERIEVVSKQLVAWQNSQK